MKKRRTQLAKIHFTTVLVIHLLSLLGSPFLSATEPSRTLPRNWDPILAADQVMDRMVKVTADRAKGAHDAEFVCVDGKAYIVEHDNDVKPGHSAGSAQYCVLAVLDLDTMQVLSRHVFAESQMELANISLRGGRAFVPRIIQVDESTLRCFFSYKPSEAEERVYYRDFDIKTNSFSNELHSPKLLTRDGLGPMTPSRFHADAELSGFTRKRLTSGFYIFDSFKEIDGEIYTALNNFPGKQNALAKLHPGFETFEVIGHLNEPQSEFLSESAIHKLPDGTWMAVVRNDGGNKNYRIAYSKDGIDWQPAKEMPFIREGTNSKPNLERFGDLYYLGWQEKTQLDGVWRSVFNLDVSNDGRQWERKYRFVTDDSFQYLTLEEHEGEIYFSVTQSNNKASTDKIMFGHLQSAQEYSHSDELTKNDSPAEQYNVLFITADDLNCDLGCYGNETVKTPHIDRLAKMGTLFTRAYCQYPLCGPSRASFLTGFRPSTLNIFVNRSVGGKWNHDFRLTRPDIRSLPEHFMLHGYDSFAVGKNFHFDVPADIGTLGKGHDAQSWTQSIQPTGSDKKRESDLFRMNGSIRFSWLSDDSGQPQTDDLLTEEVLAALQKDTGTPKFIKLGFFRPHWPYVAEEKFFDLYPEQEIALRTGGAKAKPEGPAAAYASRGREEKHLNDQLERKTIQAYYASISQVDAQIGKLLHGLDKSGMLSNTIIVFTSDHGYHLGENTLWRKKTLFEAGLRVPLIIYSPDHPVQGGQTSLRTVELVDLAPTLSELAGIPTQQSDGESLVPLLENPERIWPFPAFSTMLRGRATGTPVEGINRNFLAHSVTAQGLRYTQWGDDAEFGEELYDLIDDPASENNLANSAVYRRQKERLKQMLIGNTNAVATIQEDALGTNGATEMRMFPFVIGAKPFTDRAYKVESLPEILRGTQYFSGKISGSKLIVASPGKIYALTASEGKGSRRKELRALGFTEIDNPMKSILGPDFEDLTLLRKTAHKGEELQTGKFSLFLGSEGTRFVSDN